MKQTQFLDVIERDEAERRFHRALGPVKPVGAESIPLTEATGRVLAVDIRSGVDVTGFDRAMMDGFAVRANDTIGAHEQQPRLLKLIGDHITPGMTAGGEVAAGSCVAVSTGAMIPRGADAVIMVEHTDVGESEDEVLVTHGVAAGSNIMFAGTDIARGQLILAAGTVITSREIGVAAAIGLTSLSVVRQPTVAVLSTGNEVVAPGQVLPPACVYDSNAAIISAAVREAGGLPQSFGIIPDDESALQAALTNALSCDVVILSGGTSKGEGDLCGRVVQELCDPGIVVHGVALKPGKPVCLAVHQSKPVFVLPGFPTSAVFTFHEFAAPLIRQLAGLPADDPGTVSANVPVRLNAQKGRVEYALVSLIDTLNGLVAWPLGSGSGSVTTFSLADGFIRIDQHTEFLDAGSVVKVRLLSKHIRPADLVFIGSHCNRLEALLCQLRRQGFHCKALFVGSHGGLAALRSDQCDLTGIHLIDPDTGEFNRPFLDNTAHFVQGYSRMQGIVCRPDDTRFSNSDPQALIESILSDADCRMINRNSGSGTRQVIDSLLAGGKPPGYSVQPGSHNAVCAAVEQGRADWGVAIQPIATQYAVRFIPLSAEQYDFAIPQSRLNRPAVKAFLQVLEEFHTAELSESYRGDDE